MTSAAIEEEVRLKGFYVSIRSALNLIDSRLNDYAQRVKTRKEDLWEAQRDMDHIEKIAVRQTI